MNAKPRMKCLVRVMDPADVDGIYNCFAKVPYGVPVGLNMPLADDGYGKVTINGTEMPHGQTFFAMGQNILLVPMGLA